MLTGIESITIPCLFKLVELKIAINTKDKINAVDKVNMIFLFFCPAARKKKDVKIKYSKAVKKFWSTSITL